MRKFTRLKITEKFDSSILCFGNMFWIPHNTRFIAVEHYARAFMCSFLLPLKYRRNWYYFLYSQINFNNLQEAYYIKTLLLCFSNWLHLVYLTTACDEIFILCTALHLYTKTMLCIFGSLVLLAQVVNR